MQISEVSSFIFDHPIKQKLKNIWLIIKQLKLESQLKYHLPKEKAERDEQKQIQQFTNIFSANQIQLQVNNLTAILAHRLFCLIHNIKHNYSLGIFKDFNDHSSIAQKIKQKYSENIQRQSMGYKLITTNSFYTRLLILHYYYNKQTIIDKYQFATEEQLQIKLSQILKIYNKFYIDYCKQLRYLTKKHQNMIVVINSNINKELMNKICVKQISSKIRINLSQILRNLIRNGYKQCQVQDLIHIAEQSNQPQIKQALFYCIIHFKDDQKAKIFLNNAKLDSDNNQINHILLQHQILLDLHSKEKNIDKQIKFINQNNLNISKNIQNYYFKNKLQTKKIQSIQQQQIYRQFKLIRQLNNINTRERQQIIDPIQFKPIQPEGKDRSLIAIKTFKQIRNLYMIALKNRILKKSDKDQYLFQIFMNSKAKNFAKGKLGQFLIDRMIARIYCIISQKQSLTTQTLKNLIEKCLKNSSLFKKQLLQSLKINSQQNLFIQFTSNLNQQYCDPDEKECINKFIIELKSIDRNKIQIIYEQFDQIRVDAIKTIKNAILSQTIFQQIKQFLFTKFQFQLRNHQQNKIDSQYFSILLQICNSKKGQYFQNRFNDNNWQILLFINCIHELSYNKSKKQSLQYLQKITQKTQLHSKLFKNTQIYDIINILQIQQDKYIKLLINIIINYLLNQNMKSIDISNFDKLKKKQSFLQSFKKQFYTLYYLNTLKRQNNNNYGWNQQISSLIDDFKRLQNQKDDQGIQYIILLIFQNISKQFYLSDANIFANLLNNRSSYKFIQKQFIFYKQSTDQKSILISQIAAKILYQSVNYNDSKLQLSQNSLQNIFRQLQRGNLQTKIILSQLLKIYTEKKIIAATYLTNLQLLFDEEIFDVRLNIIKTYLNLSMTLIEKDSQNYNINELHAILLQQIEFDGKNISFQINKKIFNLLYLYVKSTKFQQFRQKKTFQIIRYILNSKELNQIKQAIQILKIYSKKFWIPRKTLEALDMIFEQNIFDQTNMEDFKKIKQEIYTNLIANQQQITVYQANIWVQQLLSCQDPALGKKYFEKLYKISKNQNLPNSIFNIIDLQKNCMKLGQKFNSKLQQKIVNMTKNGVPLNICLSFSNIIKLLDASSSINCFKIIKNLSQNQQIPHSTIEKLITLYNPQSSNIGQKQKLIAEIIVNNYLNYQIEQILQEPKIIRSYHNQSLLQITLPILLKQDFQNLREDSNHIIQTLNKFAQFYLKTQDLRHKQAISNILSRQNAILFLNKVSPNIEFEQIFTIPKQYTQNLYNNCQKGLKYLQRHGSRYACQYLKTLKRPFASSSLGPVLQQSLSQKKLKDCLILIQGCHIQFESTRISEKIMKILNDIKTSPLRDNQEKEEKIKKQKLKIDYLYSLSDLRIILNEFEQYYKPRMEQVYEITNNTEKDYLQLIIMVSGINQKHIHEDLLINNKYFVHLIEKLIKKSYITIEILQIYSKIIRNLQANQLKIIFDIIIKYLYNCQQIQISYNLLDNLYNILNLHSIVLNQFINKQHKILLLNILQNYVISKIQKIKYLSIKIFKRLTYININEIPKNYQQLYQNMKYHFSFLNQQLIYQYLQILAIQPSNNFLKLHNSQQQIIQQIIFNNFLNQVSINQLNNINFYAQWKQLKIKLKIKQRIKILIQFYLLSSYNIPLKNFHQYIKNDMLIENESIQNIKNHHLNIKIIHKILIQNYLIKLQQKKIIFKQQQILHYLYYQQINYINNLFISILKFNDPKHINQALIILLKHKISLQKLFNKNNIITIQDIRYSQILIILKIYQLTQQQQNYCQQLIKLILQKLKLSSLIKSLFKFKSIINNKIFIIEFLQMVTHFQSHRTQYLTDIVSESIKQYGKKLNHKQLIQIINKNYISKIRKKNNGLKQGVQITQKIKQSKDQKHLNKQISEKLLKDLNFISKNEYRNSFPNQEFSLTKNLNDWKDKDFKKWAKQAKRHRKHILNTQLQFNKQALSIVKAAFYNGTSNNKVLRDSQIISCLMMLNNYQNILNSKKGKLFQISTGQGKSTIICAVAIILALKGYQIDIITTTSILAERDVHEFEPIYNKFGITVAHNSDKVLYKQGQKKCYKSNVVYGQISQFQFDYLRQNYNQLGTLAGREHKIVIVDEVDSMLIDDSSKIAKISSNIAGIQKIQIIYLLIWERLQIIKQKFYCHQNRYYYLQGRLQQKQGILFFYYLNQHKQEKQLKDLTRYLSHDDISQTLRKYIIPVSNFTEITKQLLLKMKQEVNNNKQIHIPQNFKQFVEIQFPRWVQSAILADQYQQNIHYIIQNDSPAPVDYDNTGKIQQSTHWGNGLHQFLQLKHFLKLTPENLTTNFISNIKYFNIYEKIIGVTGTLGSKCCKQTLCQVYNSNIFIIPDSFEKYLIKYPLIIAKNSYEWVQEITKRVQYELNKNRGVLVIVQTIQYCNYIYRHLNKLQASKIKMYSMNDRGQEQFIKQIKPKQIIIATNLAGRGTDIKTTQIQNYGGLHLIITFLPKNVRVEDQAIGRTARGQNSGSYQIIINQMQLPNELQNVNNLTKERDRLEQQKLDQFSKNQKYQLQKKDFIFQKFCQLLKIKKQTLKKEQKYKSSSNIQTQINIIDNNKNLGPIQKYTILAIEQRWALFLNQLDQKYPDKYEKLYLQFQQQIHKDFNETKNNQFKNQIIKSPFYLSMIGYQLLNAQFNIKKHFKNLKNQDMIFQSKKYFIYAIKADPSIISAYTGLAEFCLKIQDHQVIQKMCQQVFKQKTNMTYKQLTLYYYQKALLNIQNQMKILQIIRNFAAGDQSNKKSLLTQTSSKYQILSQYYKNTIEVKQEIKKSKKLVTLIKKNIQNRQYEYFSELERKSDQLNNLLKEGNNHDFQLRFHNLGSNLNNQTDQIFYSLKKLNIQTLDSNNLNLYFKNLNWNQLNQYLLGSQVKRNLSHSDAFKFIKKQKSDEIQNIQYVIYSKIQDKKFNFNRSQALQYLQENKKFNGIYDITFCKYKKIRQQFIQQKNITIQCHNLQFNKVKQLCQRITCQKYQIQIIIKKDHNFYDINNFLISKTLAKNIHLEKFKAHQPQIKNKSYYSIYQLKYCQQNFIKDYKLVIKQLNKDQLLNITQKFKDQFGVLKFNFCSNLQILDQLENTEFSILIHDFIKSSRDYRLQQFKKMVKMLQFTNFDLIIKNISTQNLLKLCQTSLQQQDVNICGKRQISDLFPKAHTPYNQIYQYIQEGIQYLLTAKELKAIPFSSLLGLGAIAAVQMFSGLILCSSGIGAIWGTGLMIESVADFVTMARIGYTRQFNWKVYAITKMISIGCIVFFGVNAFGVVGTTLLSAAKGNGVKMVVQLLTDNRQGIKQLISSSLRIQDPQTISHIKNKIDGFKYREIIDHIIHQRINQYFMSSCGLLIIINKMLTLDIIDQSNLWTKKLNQLVKSLLTSEDSLMETKMQRLAQILTQKISQGQQYNNFEQFIRIKESKHLNQIIVDFCQQFNIKVHEIEKSRLKLNNILKKYSTADERSINEICQAVNKAQNIIKHTKFNIDGIQHSYFYQNLKYTLPIGLEVDINNDFFLKLKEISNRQNIQNQYTIISDLISKQISNIFINKLLEKISNPIINQKYDRYSVRKSFSIQQQLIAANNLKDHVRNVKTSCNQALQLELNLFQTHKEQSSFIKQYRQLIYKSKSASPIDVMFLLEQYHLSQKQLVQSSQANGKKSQNIISYSHLEQGYYTYKMNMDSQDLKKKQFKDQGFFQISVCLKMSCQKLRRQYLKLLQKKSEKFIYYLRNFYQLYQPAILEFTPAPRDQILQVRQESISFKQTLKRYQCCCLLQKIKSLEKCINEHIKIKKSKTGEDQKHQATINIKYDQQYHAQIQSLIVFIKQKKVIAQWIQSKQQKIEIKQQFKLGNNKKGKLTIQVQLNLKNSQ